MKKEIKEKIIEIINNKRGMSDDCIAYLILSLVVQSLAEKIKEIERLPATVDDTDQFAEYPWIPNANTRSR